MAKSEDDHYYGNKADIENHDGSGKAPKKSRGKKSRGGRLKGKKRRMSLIRMGGDNPDDEEKKDDEAPADDAPPADDSPADDATEVDGEADGYDNVDEILDMLEEFNIALPDDTDDSNLLDRLRTALHTAIAHKGGSTDDAPDAGAGDDQMQVASPMMQTMSLQSKTAFLFAEKIHRDNIQRDLKQLLADGKCTPVEIKERETSLKAIKLSLDDQGNTKPSDIEKWIASRQPVPKGTFWDASQRLSLQVIDQPVDLNGGLTPEQAQNVADWALGKKK